jgi:excisionase family DNA binding protein
MGTWMTVQDLQEELQVSQATAYRILKHLPVLRVGTRLRIKRADLARIAEENGGYLPTGPVEKKHEHEMIG